MTSMEFTIHLGKEEKKLKMFYLGAAEAVQANISLLS